jgi:uncharacterized protein (DUF488 family)
VTPDVQEARSVPGGGGPHGASERRTGGGAAARPLEATPRARGRRAGAVPLFTIGYERATLDAVVGALRDAGVELLVDVRAVTSSRRPGFSKNRLAAHVIGHGIDYLHLRGLGTPAGGRAAARAGRHAEMRRVYTRHLKSVEARDDLDTLAQLVAGGRRACLLCFEADPAHCHRSLVAEALQGIVPLEVRHLSPRPAPDRPK